ncbi:MAG: carboxymuconolactone decarboxylase family protein [Betaproteobacteria bacterium]
MTEIDGGEAKVAELGDWRASGAFSDRERAALEYAERITHTGQKVDDALFARVKEHFSEPQIVELTAAIALENFRSKFNPALRVEAQGFCLLPRR